MVLDYAYGAASFVMPNVLSKLGAEVLSVNPYASTRQSLTFDRWEHAAQVGELVRAAGRPPGRASSTPNGEYITLVDDNGHILTDDEALMALLRLVLADAERRGAAADGGLAGVGRVAPVEDDVRRRRGDPVVDQAVHART